MQGISWLAEKLLASQEGLCSMELVSMCWLLRCVYRANATSCGLCPLLSCWVSSGCRRCQLQVLSTEIVTSVFVFIVVSFINITSSKNLANVASALHFGRAQFYYRFNAKRLQISVFSLRNIFFYIGTLKRRTITRAHTRTVVFLKNKKHSFSRSSGNSVFLPYVASHCRECDWNMRCGTRRACATSFDRLKSVSNEWLVSVEAKIIFVPISSRIAAVWLKDQRWHYLRMH
jgi:hypothetical protein